MKMLKENAKFKVYLKDGVKFFRSRDYNFNFDPVTGLFARWGFDKKDNPEWSPFGPEILDIEITTECGGVNGKLCKYCYKANTPDGKHMSLENFKKVIEQVNYNKQLTQVAFGLGAQGFENSYLMNMCKYLRENHIIPNGTVAQLTHKAAEKIALAFGGVAVSYHSDFDVLADTIHKLHTARNYFNKNGLEKATLKQINIHFMIAEETFDECMELIRLIKSDSRYEGLNAVVLLGLKKCGRAEKGFNRLSDANYEALIDAFFKSGIGFGFDSCSANRFEQVMRAKTQARIDQIIGNEDDFSVGSEMSHPDVLLEKAKLNKLLMMIEPCESGVLSSYVNVDGVYHHCSFLEHTKGYDLLSDDASFSNFWSKGQELIEWREKLKVSDRSCPIYEV